MSWVFIQPTDVWMFRDGRPFVAGEGHTVSTIFPPTPFTVQGALRSLILGHEPIDWPDFWGQTTDEAKAMGKRIGFPARKANGAEVPASLGAFTMQGPFLGRWLPDEKRAELLISRPLDSYYIDDDSKSWEALHPKKMMADWTDWPSGSPLLQPLRAAKPMQKAEETEHPLLLAQSGLPRYLDEEPFQLSQTATFVGESRLGIALNYDRRRPKERMIYSLDYKRPFISQFGSDPEPGLLVRLGDGVKLPQKEGILSIGGEARAARYWVLDDKQAPHIPRPRATHQLKILLLTPAWLSGGWQPKDGDWSRFLGQDVRLVAAAIGRSHYIGGWRVPNKGWHKPMRPFVPAGSVYFFEADNPIAPVTTLTESPEGALDFGKQGFGACVNGRWSWLEQ